MPAPTNQTALTAIDLGTLPASVSQNVHDAGTTFTVWYKVTIPANGVMNGIFGFGDLITYTPRTIFYSGPAAAPVAIVTAGVGDVNKPIQVPVVAGTEYFIEFITNAGNPNPAVLLIEAEMSQQLIIPVGSIIVNDDQSDNVFPAAVIGVAGGNPINFISQFPSGENGDVLTTGEYCFNDFFNNEIEFFDSQFNLVITVNIGVLEGFIRACHGVQLFYVGEDSNPIVVKSYTGAGVLRDTHTLTAINSMKGIASNNDETILYHSLATSGAAVNRWDLIADAALTDLVAGVAGYFIIDILVLSDDTIVFSSANSATGDLDVYRYNAAGALLNTFSLGLSLFPSGTFPRLAYAIDDPNSFWVWTHPSAPAGGSRFREIKISDGTFIQDIATSEYEIGVGQKAAAATPTDRFGNSFSCPFVVSRQLINSTNTNGATGGSGVSGIFISAQTVQIRSGIYKIVPDKRNDTLWDQDLVNTTDVKIPNPFVKSALLGE